MWYRGWAWKPLMDRRASCSMSINALAFNTAFVEVGQLLSVMAITLVVQWLPCPERPALETLLWLILTIANIITLNKPKTFIENFTPVFKSGLKVCTNLQLIRFPGNGNNTDLNNDLSHSWIRRLNYPIVNFEDFHVIVKQATVRYFKVGFNMRKEAILIGF